MTPSTPVQLSARAGDLLVLAPCLPRPDGDAASLRWFHLLRFLARHYRVHLGCRADPLRDGAQFSRVRALCHETCFAPPAGVRARLRPGAGGDAVLLDWAMRLCARQAVRAVLACGAGMGGHLAALPRGLVRVVDFVELESDRSRRHGAVRPWPGAALWRRQARRLLAAERAAGAACDHALFAGAADVARFRLFAPESAHKARLLPSGIDPEHYSPHIVQRSPFQPGERALVMAGPLDGPAGADAAHWLAHEVFAPLRAADPSLALYLVGPPLAAGADRRLRALARQPGVTLGGKAADARPYLAHAALVLAPPGAGHAASMAVLAAMAMQKTVLGLPHALAGLACLALPEAWAAADAPAFRARIGALLSGAEGSAATVGRAARARVLREHDWNLRLAGLPALFQAAPQPLASAG
ncbi:glycosyltransferase [Massilia sp. YIM B02769]|uniref:glycosyltransferase n=1 Tax=Massilia sp. YIM B02769 TaxID=3050129 RepID=UPI0025B7102A|nr:glycosyltransferase [Massilia sp. YIM B02769]MDN4059241.1 glycosyltransferase [Massilia sp. YIM B02769]